MERRRGIRNAANWIFVTALIFGVQPLKLSFQSIDIFKIIYSTCYLIFFIALGFSSINSKINLFEELIKDDNTIETTMSGSIIGFTSGLIINNLILLLFVFTKYDKVSLTVGKIDSISKYLNYNIYDEVKNYARVNIVIIVPVYIFMCTKEIVLYTGYSVFYSSNLDSLFVIIRLSSILYEEEIKVIVYSKRKLFTKINQEIENILVQLTRLAARVSSKRMERLRKAHEELCALGDEISTTFQLPLLLGLLLLMTDIVQGFYFVFVGAMDKAGSLDVIRWTLSLDSLTWGVLNTIRLLIFTRTHHQATATANDTRRVVQKLELNVECKASLREEVRIFNTQLLHCSKPQYTVFSMFNLDMTFFASVMGAVATYMVILLQFHTRQQETCDCESAYHAITITH